MSYYTSVIIMVLFALGVLSILISENDRIPKKRKRLFIATNLLIALAALAECAGVHLNGNPAYPKTLLAVVKALDYTLTPMAGGALILLIQKQGQKSRLFKGLLLANAVFQFLGIFFGWTATIDDSHTYSHGPLYPVYIVFYSLIILCFTVSMLAYGKSFRKQNRKSLYATILLIFTGIAIQELGGNGSRVSYLALTLGVSFLFIHYSEFSQLQLDDKILEQQAQLSIDALTGVFSRFAYIGAMDACAEHTPEDLAVFLMDINGLKSTNDTLGHEAGDEMIRGAARCIEAAFGKHGHAYRIGGDEFVVLASMDKAQSEEAMRTLKAETDAWTGVKVKKLSLSVGCALAKEYPDLCAEELIKEADKGMYAQKKEYYCLNGRDRRRAVGPQQD